MNGWSLFFGGVSAVALFVAIVCHADNEARGVK